MQIVNGIQIEFINERCNLRQGPVHKIKFDKDEQLAIEIAITKLLNLSIIERTSHEVDEFISNIFTRPKKDGGHRVILNLKKLNEDITYHHFKMDTFMSAIQMITPGCYMASIDLKDAYYSVPIADEYQKYLKFEWANALYKFKALPNGLASGPRLFTKLMKVPLAVLRQQGCVIIAYIDDTLLIGDTKLEVERAVSLTKSLFIRLGFLINLDKSVLTPTQNIEFLGFRINSTEMSVTLTKHKKDKIRTLCWTMLSNSFLSIQELASVTGKLIATFPAVNYGGLHYRELEKLKVSELKKNRGHYKAQITLNDMARSELKWWISNLEHSYGHIHKKQVTVTIETDASGRGWGAYNGVDKIGGRWNHEEELWASKNEINYLELWAGFLALKAFTKDISDTHVLIKMDNTTAIAYINNMGGMKSTKCNDLAKTLWEYCIHKQLWVTAVHLPGRDNSVADKLSREFKEEIEWQLNPKVFHHICLEFGQPQIDLFASRLNRQLARFVSWKPDPDAFFVDALMFDWGGWFFYAFPPFSLINKCIQKIQLDQAEGLLITPVWPTQAWYSRLVPLMLGEPLLLPKSKKLITNVMTGAAHPIPNLQLMCCRLSGKKSKALTEPQNYRKKPLTSSLTHGNHLRRNNMVEQSTNGRCFVTGDRQICFKRLLVKC